MDSVFCEFCFWVDFDLYSLSLGVPHYVSQPSWRKEPSCLKYVNQIIWSDQSYFNLYLFDLLLIYMVLMCTSGRILHQVSFDWLCLYLQTHT